MTSLPMAEPPSDRRASVAVAFAPVVVAVVLALVVSGLIAFETGVALALGCAAWVVYEMLDYQRAVDAYEQEWVQADPMWQGSQAFGAEAQPAQARRRARARLSARGTLQFEPSRL